jgi:hypothetical protein
MKFKFKWALAAVPALALAMPALAQTRDTRLADFQEPGSVLVWPKFINSGTVNVDGTVTPRTEIEIGVVNPPNTGIVLPEHTTVKVHLHWVCPGTQSVASKFTCPETDFVLFLSINGKLAFAADGKPIANNSGVAQNTPRVPFPGCANGYLIAWVVDNLDRPIKFDGLIGDAVIRGMNLGNGPSTGFSTAVESYRAIAIQAFPGTVANPQPTWNGTLGTGLLAGGTDPITGAAALAFDGAPGHYQAVSGSLYGDVKFDNPTGTGNLNRTYLVLLTLDVRSSRPNNPTFVPLTFYNESLAGVSTTNPLWENPTSTNGVDFLCWGQFSLTPTNAADPTTGIDGNLTQALQGSRKGIVLAGPAEQDNFIGINDPPYTDNDPRRTLIGMVQTNEGTLANAFQERGYIFQMYDNSVPIPTRFVPFGL